MRPGTFFCRTDPFVIAGDSRTDGTAITKGSVRQKNVPGRTYTPLAGLFSTATLSKSLPAYSPGSIEASVTVR